MRTTHRNYSEENGDFNRLARFFTAYPKNRRTHTTWCLARLVDWKYALYLNKRVFASFCNENAHIWFDGFGELAGFAVSESGDAGFSILRLDGYRFLYEEMLSWVLEIWKGRVTEQQSRFSTEIIEHQDWEIKIIERYGFRVEAPFFTRRFELTGDLVPRLPLEAGFKIVDMKSNPDFRAQSILHANAFQNKGSLTEEEMNDRIKYFNHSIGGLCITRAPICVWRRRMGNSSPAVKHSSTLPPSKGTSNAAARTATFVNAALRAPPFRNVCID